jgi:hypothetical protein
VRVCACVCVCVCVANMLELGIAHITEVRFLNTSILDFFLSLDVDGI